MSPALTATLRVLSILYYYYILLADPVYSVPQVLSGAQWSLSSSCHETPESIVCRRLWILQAQQGHTSCNLEVSVLFTNRPLAALHVPVRPVHLKQQASMTTRTTRQHGSSCPACTWPSLQYTLMLPHLHLRVPQFWFCWRHVLCSETYSYTSRCDG